MLEEIWKDLSQIDNLTNYMISSYGNIKNKNTGKILKQRTSYGGYSSLNILKNNYSVHRLVAIAFLDNYLNKPTVNHIDKNRSNNHLSNLEWASYKEQSQHSPVLNHNNNRGIWKIDIITNEKIKKYNTLNDAAIDTTGKLESFKNISSCARMKTKSAYGFKWEYDDKYDDLENEVWKYFDNSNYYFVSNYGRIKNKNNR